MFSFFRSRTATICLGVLLSAFTSAATADILVKVDGISGSSRIRGYEGWFPIDSFEFAVTRTQGPKSGKAGTADLGLGAAEIQPIQITKPFDSGSIKLARAAIAGSQIGNVDIAFVRMKRDGTAEEFLRYRLEVTYVKEWSTTGDADDNPTEDVTLMYTRISLGSGNDIVGWDFKRNSAWRPQTR